MQAKIEKCGSVKESMEVWLQMKGEWKESEECGTWREEAKNRERQAERGKKQAEEDTLMEGNMEGKRTL